MKALLVLFFIARAKKLSRVTEEGNNIVLSSGVRLSGIDKQTKSGQLIHKWASELEKTHGSVTHSQAVQRERFIVSGIESGSLPMRAYHDYQRFAAGTGNVDSAELLMSFGVGVSISSMSKAHKLHLAAARCDISTFTRLANSEEYSGGINAPSEDGTTPLIAAAFVGCLPIIKKILSEAIVVDVDGAGANGATALMVAAARGHVEVLSLLVNNGGATITARHKFAGSTALHFAAELSQAGAISRLCRLLGQKTLERGEDEARGGEGASVAAFCDLRTSVGSSPLHTAAQKAASQETILALARDCDCFVDALLNDDTTPLYLAAQEGHMEALRGLILANATVDFVMPHTAYKGTFNVARVPHSGSGSSVKVEVEVDGDPWISQDEDHSPVNTEAGNGATALHVAAENGHAEALKVLLNEGGANINGRSIGTTALHLAVQYNRSACVEVLLARPDLLVDEAALTDGSTALYGAAGRGYAPIVSQLLLARASPMLPAPRSGGLPLLYAVIRNRTDVVELLLLHANSSSVESNDHTKQHSMLSRMIGHIARDGTTALSAACSLGHATIVSLLLRFGGGGGVLSSRNHGLEAANVAKGSKVEDRGLTSLSSCLLQAVRSRSLDTVRAVLLQQGATAQSLALAEPMVLLSAIESDQIDIVQILLEHGWPPDKGLDDERAGVRSHPLLLAVARGRAKTVSLLLEHGSGCDILVARQAKAKAKEQNSEQQEADTLVDIARSRRDFDTLQALMSHEECHPERVRGEGGQQK